MAETVRIEIPIEVRNNTGPGLSNVSNGINHLGQAVNRTQGQVNRFDQASQRTQKGLLEWAKQKYRVALEAMDKIGPVLAKLKTGLKTVTGKAWKVTMKAVDLVTSPVRGILKILKNPLFQVGAVLGVSIGLKDTIDTFANFEAAMSKVKAISGANEEQFVALTEKAKQMGATTKFTATESAEAFTYMGMAGWKAKEMMEGIGGIMSLSAADGLDLATTSDIVTDALTAFGLKASDSSHFADVLAKASSSANTNVAMMGETFKYVAPVAGSLGYSVEDTAVAIGLMANSGIKASQAGTQLRAAIVNMIKPTNKQEAMMQRFGISIQNSDGSMKSLMEVMTMLREKMGKLTETEKQENFELLTGIDAKTAAADAMNGLTKEEIANKTALGLGLDAIKKYNTAQINSALYKRYSKTEIKNMTDEQKRNVVAMDQGKVLLEGMTQAQQAQSSATIFGKEAMSGWLAIINTSDKDFEKLTKEIYNSEGAAKRMADTMLDNLQGAFILLQSAAEGVKVTLGERLKPYLLEFTRWLTMQMPNIQKGINQFFDEFDYKIKNLKRTMKDVMEGEKWKNADLFGKIKIAWDKIIGEPFSKWWNSTGKVAFQKMAGSIGKGMGSAISGGLLMLLGVDFAKATEEGASMGLSFAKGFAKGFDGKAIKEKIGIVIKGIFSDALKVLPGGEAPSLSSWISAALIAKIAAPLIGLLAGGARLGRGVFGGGGAVGQAGAAGAASVGLGRRIIGSAAAGTGILGKGAMTAIKLGGGNLAGGASLSAGALSALGLSSIAGGVMGGIGVYQGAKDIHQAFTSKDKKEQKKYGWRGGTKLGMVGAGAATGAAIGTVIPVVGTAIGGLIGAGIGGLGAVFSGNKVADTLSGTGGEIRGINKETKELEKETKELEERAKALNRVTYEAKRQSYEKHFGKVALSMGEIKKVASDIIQTKSMKQLNQFSKELVGLEEKGQELGATISSLNKNNWKLTLGLEFSEDDLKNYKETLENLAKQTTDYLEQDHYTVSIAIDTFIDDESKAEKYKKELDEYYADVSKKVKALNEKLKTTHEKVTARDSPDGANITKKEAKELIEVQKQITETKNKNISAEFDANMQVYEFKYTSGSLDAKSFEGVQEQMQLQEAEAIAEYDKALGASLSFLEKIKGDISPQLYEEMETGFKKGYLVDVGEIKLKSANFQMNGILEAYQKEIKHSNLDKNIKKCLEELVVKAQKDPSSAAILFTPEYVMKLLGVDKLDVEVVKTLEDLYKNLIPTKESLEALQRSAEEFGIDLSEDTKQSIEAFFTHSDLLGILAGDADTMYSKLADEVSKSPGYQKALQVLSLKGALIPDKMLEAVQDENLPGFILDTKNKNRNLTNALTENFMENRYKSEFDFVEPPERLTNQIFGSFYKELESTEFPLVGVGVIAGIQSSIQNASDEPIRSEGKALKNRIQTLMNANFSTGIVTSTDVKIKMNYLYENHPPTKPPMILKNPYAPEVIHRSGYGISQNANGDIINGPLLSWVGEDGPEAIIPLGGKRRTRGLSLWEKAGERLGVQKFAKGGVVGNSNRLEVNKIASKILKGQDEWIGEEESRSQSKEIPVSSRQGNGKQEIMIHITCNPSFDVTSNESGNHVVDTIKAHMKELADELSGEIAYKLGDVFSNMPIRA